MSERNKKKWIERMTKEKRVRQRGRGLDYPDVQKKRSREDLVGRDEKREWMKKGTDRRIKKKRKLSEGVRACRVIFEKEERRMRSNFGGSASDKSMRRERGHHEKRRAGK